MRKRAAGLGLLETLVALGVAILLSMMILRVIFPSFRIVQEGFIRTELQQQGELALHQLQSDLQRTVPTGVSLAPPFSAGDGMLVATNPLKETLPTGLEFQPQLVVYSHDVAKQQLFREVFPPAPPSLTLNFHPFKALQVPRPTLVQITTQSSGWERSLAKAVVTFEVELVPTSGGETYRCFLKLEKPIPGKNRLAVVELSRKVMLRNHQ
jgi:hypothetical protein